MNQTKMNFKNILLTSILVLTIKFGFSQSIVKGKVLDANNLPITGANITLSSNIEKQGTTSGFEGNFSIQIKENGTYNITITFLGFENYSKNIVIQKNETIDLNTITLIEASELLQSIEITGRKRKDYNSDYSFSASKLPLKTKNYLKRLLQLQKN